MIVWKNGQPFHEAEQFELPLVKMHREIQDSLEEARQTPEYEQEGRELEESQKPVK